VAAGLVFSGATATHKQTSSTAVELAGSNELTSWFVRLERSSSLGPFSVML
jgi:hypothetical protein